MLVTLHVIVLIAIVQVKTAADKSRTWAAHVRYSSMQYNLPGPFTMSQD